jgi:putative cardiolipin synthase
MDHETSLDTIAMATSTGHAGQSGFRLLHMGPTSLHARLELIQRAERSLDLQYYQVDDDESSHQILRALRDAAVRGVRVRLLVDDMYTSGMDPIFTGLAAHPNVQVRLFNPFPNRGSISQRFAASLFDFGRVNRRMHNKLLIADSAVGLTGGRNIGNAYHGYDPDINFFDFELVVVGAVLPQMSDVFDFYWNSRRVYPVESIALSHASKPELIEGFEDRTFNVEVGNVVPLPAKDRMGNQPLSVDLNAGAINLIWGSATYMADHPDKSIDQAGSVVLPSGARLEPLRMGVGRELVKAKHEIFMTSPYLVPGREALNNMKVGIKRGVKFTLLTNSYMSTDEPIVHTGYRRYRDEMLEAGIDLYELSPEHTKRLYTADFLDQDAWFRWHAKSIIIDKKTLYIGSMNFDPRSESLNTEAGLIIESPELAEVTHKLVWTFQQEASYQVRFADKLTQRLEWIRVDDLNGIDIQTREPGLKFWDAIKLNIQSLLIPEFLL